VQLLLEGEVLTRQGAFPPRRRAAPFAVGLEAVLCGGRLPETAQSDGNAVWLVVGAHELLALLTEDAELLRALLRGTLADVPSGGEARVLRGQPQPQGSAAPASRTLERIRRLEGSPLFARASADQLLRLAEIARDEPLAQGAVLFEAEDTAAIHVLEGGEVALEGEAGLPVVARAGDTLGVHETLGGSRGGPARVTATGQALRIEGDALFELLAEDVDLLQGVFSALRASPS
jgi:hypothetical protein